MQSKVSFRLTVRQGPVPGKAIELAKDIIVMGRDVNNDIVVNDAEVSRTHTRLTAQGESYIVEDLASTNGTFLNGQRLTGPKLMRHGDMLGLGETVVMEFGVLKDARDPDSTMVASGSAPYNLSSSASAAGPLPDEPTPMPRVVTAPLSQPSPPPISASPLPVSSPPRDNRPMIIGGVCGCLTLCGCLATIAGLVYAYSQGMLPF
jgi:pSer/pThr/pTyr-binding forkhead associated (FHA) protein